MQAFFRYKTAQPFNTFYMCCLPDYFTPQTARLKMPGSQAVFGSL